LNRGEKPFHKWPAGNVDQLSGAKALDFQDAKRHGSTGCGKNTFCHPERSEGSAFLPGFQETADSSGKPRPSE
jgi:hypothetical protein